MSLPILPTTVIGSYSMPEWLERAKNDYLSRRLSRRDLDEMHDAVRKAAIKDQEVAGLDIVSDGEVQRDNMIDYFTERLPGVQLDHGLEALLLRLLRERGALEAGHRLARPGRRGAVPARSSPSRVGKISVSGPHTLVKRHPEQALPVARRRSRSISAAS